MYSVHKDLREKQGRLFVLGVGGSAGNASHAVNDFRKQDMINDGQGAPLTPIFHKLITNIMYKKKQINVF